MENCKIGIVECKEGFLRSCIQGEMHMNRLVLVLAVVILVIALQKRLRLIMSRVPCTLYEFSVFSNT